MKSSNKASRKEPASGRGKGIPGFLRRWKTADEVFAWWMEDDNIPGQMNLDDFLEEE